MQPTKKPTRSYGDYSDTPWSFWDVLYERRSHRKFMSMPPDAGLSESLEEVAGISARARGARAGSILVVTEPDTVERIKKRACKGFVNKINMWLPRNPVSGFLLLVVDRGEMRAARPRELPLAAMALEDCVLWLAEQGIGTCWLAGVNSREILEAVGLEGDRTLPVAVPFGRPKPRATAADFDAVLYRTLSRKRKTLEEIACLEDAGSPYRVEEIPREPFSAPEVQDVKGLLLRLTEVGGGAAPGRAPLDLALDACLESARIAPNGGNFQAWRFVAVREAARLEELERACGSSGGWSAAVVGAGVTKRFESGLFDKPFWMLDVPIALSHISLMAASMGYGAESCVSDIEEEEVNRICGLAPGLRTVGVVGLR